MELAGDLLVVDGKRYGFRAPELGARRLAAVGALELLLDDREREEAVLLEVEDGLEAPDVAL